MRLTAEVLGMGFNNTGYAGAFTPVVVSIVKSITGGKILHLYSGNSLIGDERIDIEHKNATQNCDVKDFIAIDNRFWDWVILDPPYAITRADVKLKEYGIKGCVSSDVRHRRNLKEYLRKHTNNIIWLDYSAPMVSGFKREKLWLLLPGGFHTVRVLSWLKRNQLELQGFCEGNKC
jgi:hypothetical protein